MLRRTAQRRSCIGRFILILINFIRIDPLFDRRVAADRLEIRIIEYLSVAYVDFSLALVRHH